MTSFVEEIGLHALGLNDDQINQVNAILPDVQHLLATYKAEQPRIARIIPVAQMLLAQIQKFNNGEVR